MTILMMIDDVGDDDDDEIICLLLSSWEGDIIWFLITVAMSFSMIMTTMKTPCGLQVHLLICTNKCTNTINAMLNNYHHQVPVLLHLLLLLRNPGLPLLLLQGVSRMILVNSVERAT